MAFSFTVENGDDATVFGVLVPCSPCLKTSNCLPSGIRRLASFPRPKPFRASGSNIINYARQKRDSSAAPMACLASGRARSICDLLLFGATEFGRVHSRDFWRLERHSSPTRAHDRVCCTVPGSAMGIIEIPSQSGLADSLPLGTHRVRSLRSVRRMAPTLRTGPNVFASARSQRHDWRRYRLRCFTSGEAFPSPLELDVLVQVDNASVPTGFLALSTSEFGNYTQ